MMHIKPSIRHRGNHIIGKSADAPDKPGKTILLLMVCCSIGGPSFVAGLIPVFSLKHAFLTEQLEWLLRIVHNCGGFVFLYMSDNLRCNQSTYDDHHTLIGTCTRLPNFYDRLIICKNNDLFICPMFPPCVHSCPHGK